MEEKFGKDAGLAKSLVTRLSTYKSVVIFSGNAPWFSKTITRDTTLYRRYVADLQRFRGKVWLADNAISADELSEDGRHISSYDEQAWHILILNSSDEIVGCIRAIPWNCNPTFSLNQLALYPLIERMSTDIRSFYEDAIQNFVDPKHNSLIVEVGGWAVDRKKTSLTIAPILACSIWAIWGLHATTDDRVGIVAATTRHSSNKMLKKIGLVPIGTLPTFFDPVFNCNMEFLGALLLPGELFRSTLNELSVYLSEGIILSAETDI